MAAVAVLIALGLGGCGQGTGPDASLTSEQAAKVAQAVSAETYHLDFGSTGSAALRSDPVDHRLSPSISAATTASFSFREECPGGGSVRWAGDAHLNDAGDSLSVDGTLQFDQCTSTVDGSTVTVTTSRDSGFDFTGTLLVSSDTEVEWSSRLGGSFDWSLDGESGSCSLDLETDIVATGVGIAGEGSIEAETTGRVCGHEVERSFSLGGSSA